MGSKGSSSSSFTPPPEVVEAYKEALGYGRAAMGQKYEPYTGEITAPLTPTQEAGIYNVNRAAGTALPYYQQATELAQALGNKPITGVTSADIAKASQLASGATGPVNLQQNAQIGQAIGGLQGVAGRNITGMTPEEINQAIRLTSGATGPVGLQQNAQIGQATSALQNLAGQQISLDRPSEIGRASQLASGAVRQISPEEYAALNQGLSLTGLGGGSYIMPRSYAEIGQGALLTGDVAGRTITPDQFSQQQIDTYMSPYTKAVADATFKNLREQQQQEQSALKGQAIRAGAFGGDRAGIAAANLARQQDLATAQAMSGIYSQGYGQALGAFQQQQGVNLAAQQANAARQLQAAQQLASIGAQQQGTYLTAEQANALRQLQAGQQLSTVGLQQQAVDLSARQADAARELQASQQLAGIGTQQQALGLQAQQADVQRQLQTAQQLAGIGTQQQAADLAARQADAARQLQAAQQLAGIGTQQQAYGLQVQQADIQRALQAYQQLAGIGTQQQSADLAARQADAARQLQASQQLGALGAQQQTYGLQVQQADAQRQLQAAQQYAALGQGLQGSVLQGAQAQLAAGAQQQAVQQAIASGYYNQYLAAQAYPYQQAQYFANLATGVGGQMGGTTTGTPAQPSPVGSIFGALGALGSVFSASDKRVKENIKPIGKTNDGQTIYRYNFKGDPATQIGLIAQEVEKKHPDAVRTFNGVKGVDYKEATDDSVRSMGGGVVPSSTRKNFALGGGHSIDEEEDPMIPYVSGVPAKVRQIPKLARIGGTKPNFGGSPPGPVQGPSTSEMKGAAEGLGKLAKKYDLFGSKSDSSSSGDDSTISGISDWLREANGGVVPARRRNFDNGGLAPEDRDYNRFSDTSSDIERQPLDYKKLLESGAIRITQPGTVMGSPTGDSDPESYSIVTKWNDDQPDSYTRGWEDKPEAYKAALRDLENAPLSGGGGPLYNGKYLQILESAKKLGLADYIKSKRGKYADGEKVPKTEDTKTVSLGDVKKPDSDLPAIFRKGELSGQADEEGTPVGGVVPRPDIPLPPTGRPIDLSFPLIRKEEGFQATPIKDTDKNPRVGWSSDSQTTPEGKKIDTTWQSRSTPEEAEHDLTRRVVEGQAWIKSKIGEEAWDQLSPEAQAAMTSIRYQYGKYPQQVLAAAATGDSSAVARAISTVSGPTPYRRATEVALIGGKDIGLGNYQPGEAGYERLLQGKGAGSGSGGLGDARRVQLAQANTGTATDANKNWPGFGMAGEGKRSIIESIMDRDFDPIQKRALFSFFAGMAASPSPWFGQQLGAGMQAASQVYNDSLNKQAELNVQGQRIGLEKERVQVSKEQAETSRINAARQTLASMMPVVKNYLDAGVELPAYVVELFKQAGVPVPGKEAPPTEKKDGLGAAGTGTGTGGLQPPPIEKTPPVSGEPKVSPSGGADKTITPPIPEPTPTPKPAPKQQVTKSYQSMSPEEFESQVFAPPGASDEVKKIYSQMENIANPYYWDAKKQRLPEMREKYDDNKMKAFDNLNKTYTAPGKEGGVVYLPGYEESKKTEREQSILTETQKKNAAEVNTLRQNAASALQTMPKQIGTIEALQKIAERFEPNLLAEEKTKIINLGKSLGINVPQEALNNANSFYEFVKFRTDLVYSELKQLPGQILKAEVIGQTQAKPSPEMTAGAISELIAKLRADAEYSQKYYQDLIGTAPFGAKASDFDASKWQVDWNKENKLSQYYDNWSNEVAVRGNTPTEPRDLKVGKTYILEPGQYGNPYDRPAKFRYVLEDDPKTGKKRGYMKPEGGVK